MTQSTGPTPETNRALAALQVLLRRFDRSSLLATVACCLDWNGENASIPPPQFILQTIVHELPDGGPLNPTLADGVRVIHAVKRWADRQGQSRWTGSTLAALEAGPREGWSNFLRLQAGIIYNPGTPGEMISYAMDRFEPYDDLLRRRFGFTVGECCRTVLWVQAALRVSVRKYWEPRSVYYQRKQGPDSASHPIVTPPLDFAHRWLRGAAVGGDVLEWLTDMNGFNASAIEFLSAPSSEFDFKRKSFSRWAFLKDLSGFSILLIPGMSVETVVSAIHQGILEVMNAEELGNYGRELGRRFEDLVAEQTKSHWTSVKVDVRRRKDNNRPDADVVVSVPSGPRLLLECKGRALKPSARWGGILSFEDAIEDNIVEAAKQATEVLPEIESTIGEVRAVFLVLDAYFPGITTLWTRLPSVNRELKHLPTPVVISYYDYCYLAACIEQASLDDYLRWRTELLSLRQVYIYDEHDLVNTFRHRDEIRAEVARNPNSGLTVVGWDSGYHTETEDSALRRLGVSREIDSRRAVESSFAPSWVRDGR
jgi:hypothetical protein